MNNYVPNNNDSSSESDEEVTEIIDIDITAQQAHKSMQIVWKYSEKNSDNPSLLHQSNALDEFLY